MDAIAKKIRDREYRNKLACIHYPEVGVIEIKLFGCRVMRIRFPPGTPIQFFFNDSDPAA